MDCPNSQQSAPPFGSSLSMRCVRNNSAGRHSNFIYIFFILFVQGTSKTHLNKSGEPT